MKKIPKSEYKHSLLKNLLNIPEKDIPEYVYVNGSLPDTKKYKLITVIGSRANSPYAARAIEKLISEISGYDIVIVSGLALGIDTLAHKNALKYGLPTIAVPGSGLNDKVLYPKSNFQLSREVLEKEGCLISEFDPDFAATPWSFPQRNRVMAALSDLTLVIEASEKSGTLITARIANDYGKEVAVIPSSIFSENSKGSNMLLKQGATPVFSGKDILEILEIDEKEKVENLRLFDDMTDDEKIIYLKLKEPVYKTDLVELLSDTFEAPKTLELLSLMEIKGYISESLSKIYRK